MKLGDKVEQITRATGIKTAVDFFAEMLGVDCGCEERKERWNKWPRGFQKPQSMTAELYEQSSAAISGISAQISASKQIAIAEVYSKVFRTRYELWCNSCGKIWVRKIKELEKAIKFYENENVKANVSEHTDSDSDKGLSEQGGRRKTSTNTKGAGKVAGGRIKGGSGRQAKAVDERVTSGEYRGQQGAEVKILPRHG